MQHHPPMNNFFTNDASSDRIRHGISQRFKKSWTWPSLLHNLG